MSKPSSDVVFSATVKQLQSDRGSRTAYRRMEEAGGFPARVDGRLRAFLGQIDSAFLATASADGQPYVQHRGGPKGFIRAVDDRAVALAELEGNRQYVTAGNLLENDRICLFLIDYERRQRIKVWGRARIVPADARLKAVLGDDIERALVIEISAWDVNCPKHIPQKIGAAEVAQALKARDDRIEELEAEVRRLRNGSR
jgi:hypothetical protein